MVTCVDMRGGESRHCREKRPVSKRHCAGSCIADYNTDYDGWTRVIDGQQHSLYIDNKGEARVHVTDSVDHKAEFLETAGASYSVVSHYLFFVFCMFYFCNLL